MIFIIDLQVSFTWNVPCISLSTTWLLVGSTLVTYPNAELVEPTTFSPCRNLSSEVFTISVETELTNAFPEYFLLIYLFYLNWKLTLLLLVTAPFIALIVNVAGRRLRKIAKSIQRKLEAPGALDSVPFADNKIRLLEILIKENYLLSKCSFDQWYLLYLIEQDHQNILNYQKIQQPPS